MKLFDLFSLVCIMLYFFLAAQGGFYILVHARILQHLPAKSFLELRKLTDKIIALPLKILYPVTLAILLVRIGLADKTTFSGYGYIAIAFALLAADLALAIRFSIPLNKIIEKLPDNAANQISVLQAKWIRFILIRGYLSVSGFAFLILHLL